jgi:hypothetical protein
MWVLQVLLIAVATALAFTAWRVFVWQSGRAARVQEIAQRLPELETRQAGRLDWFVNGPRLLVYRVAGVLAVLGSSLFSFPLADQLWRALWNLTGRPRDFEEGQAIWLFGITVLVLVGGVLALAGVMWRYYQTGLGVEERRAAQEIMRSA